MSCRFSYSISSTTSWICVERFVSAVPRWYLSPRPVSDVKNTSCPFSRSSGAKLRHPVAPPQAPCTSTKLAISPVLPAAPDRSPARSRYVSPRPPVLEKRRRRLRQLAQDARHDQRRLERRAVRRRDLVVAPGRVVARPLRCLPEVAAPLARPLAAGHHHAEACLDVTAGELARLQRHGEPHLLLEAAARVRGDPRHARRLRDTRRRRPRAPRAPILALHGRAAAATEVVDRLAVVGQKGVEGDGMGEPVRHAG